MSEQQATEEITGAKVGGIRISAILVVMVALMLLLGVIYVKAAIQTNEAYKDLSDKTSDYIACEDAASDMKAGSNYLTAQVRQFVITHEVIFLDNYFTEAFETQTRDHAIVVLEELANDEQSLDYLRQSRQRSEELMQDEYHAAKLVLEAAETAPNKGAETMDAVTLSDEEQALSKQQKLNLAMDLVFGDDYQAAVDEIESDVAMCKVSLIQSIQADQAENTTRLDRMMMMQSMLTWALLLVSLILVLLVVFLVLRPLREGAARISKNELLELNGARELRVMSRQYNILYEQNAQHHEHLRRKAEIDHLTGLFNRGEFDRLLVEHSGEDAALLLIDADFFKEVNDTYGHEGGDSILKKLGDSLQHTFRSTDYPCRIGGDEFAVLMTGMRPELAYVIEIKIEALRSRMADSSDGLPAMMLSIGVAFGDDEIAPDELYRRADEALYRAKEAGRNGYAFY